MFGDLQEPRASSSQRSYTPPSTFHPHSTPDMSTYPGFPGHHRSDCRPSGYGHAPHRRSISDPFQTPPDSGPYPGQNATSNVQQQHRRQHSPHRHVAQYTSAPYDPTIFRYQHREDRCQLCAGLQLHRHDELHHRPLTPCYTPRQVPPLSTWNQFAGGAIVPPIPTPTNLSFIPAATNPRPVIPPPPPPQAQRNLSTRRARPSPASGPTGRRVMGALRFVGRWLSAYLSGSKRETPNLPRRRTMPAKIPRVFQREHSQTEKGSHSGAAPAQPELQPPIRPLTPLPNLLPPRLLTPPPPPPPSPPVPSFHPFLQHDPRNIGPITWDVSREPASILLTPTDLSQLLTRPPAIPVLDSMLVQCATDPPIQHMFINALADFPLTKCLRDPDTALTHNSPRQLELKTLPWPVRVSGSSEREGNLTCLDVFNAIYQNFQQYISRSEHEMWTTKRRRLMAAAYKQRRQQTEERWIDPYHPDTPEEEGLMRCDYLGSQVIFRGLEQNLDGGGWTLFLGPPV